MIDLKTPEVFLPLWEGKARFKGSWGGRGSGKSWDRASQAVFEMLTIPRHRVACVREVQNSIKDSVFQLMVDTIDRMNVRKNFHIIENEIRGANGSLCVFKGMKDQNADTAKSMEGFDRLWWEEAQTASQRSLDIIRPTIRKPGSELWFTWNPRLRSDPVDKFLRQTDLGDSAIVVRALWSDNPWFTDVLEEERLIDLRDDPDRYAHIWEGAYEAESDMQFIGGGMVRAAMERMPQADPSDAIVIGVDPARYGDDRSVIYPRRGRDAQTIPPIVFDKPTNTMTLVGRVIEEAQRLNASMVFVDEGGMGGPIVDRLQQLGGVNVQGVNFGSSSDRVVPGCPTASNKRAEIWATMREWLKGGSVVEDLNLESDLTGPLYKFDANNRIVLEKKEDMKKRGVRSPDLADALALTFAYPVVGPTVEMQIETKRAAEYDPIWQ